MIKICFIALIVTLIFYARLKYLYKGETNPDKRHKRIMNALWGCHFLYMVLYKVFT